MHEITEYHRHSGAFLGRVAKKSSGRYLCSRARQVFQAGPRGRSPTQIPSPALHQVDQQWRTSFYANSSL